MSSVIKDIIRKFYKETTSLKDFEEKFNEVVKDFTYETEVSLWDSNKKENVMVKRFYPLYTVSHSSNNIMFYCKGKTMMIIHCRPDQIYKEEIKEVLVFQNTVFGPVKVYY